MSLGDRQFQTVRRVQRGRMVPNDDDSKPQILQHEEYATAVVDPSGQPLTVSLENFSQLFYQEQVKTNRLLEQILIQLSGVYLEDGLALVG